MEISKWTYEKMGAEYFLFCNKKEMEELKKTYNVSFFESYSFEGDDFYYFLSKRNHTITPMRLPSDGFAGQYNGYQFDELDDNFVFNLDDYKYQFDLPYFQDSFDGRQELVVKEIVEKEIKKWKSVN